MDDTSHGERMRNICEQIKEKEKEDKCREKDMKQNR